MVSIGIPSYERQWRAVESGKSIVQYDHSSSYYQIAACLSQSEVNSNAIWSASSYTINFIIHFIRIIQTTLIENGKKMKFAFGTQTEVQKQKGINWLQYQNMFKLISKTQYSKESILKLDKYYRLMLNYDGSMSRLIENLSGESLIVDPLHHQCCAFDSVKDTLTQNLSIKGPKIQVRYAALSTKKLKLLVLAKSYWSTEAYNSIMAKNPQRAIGFNMIDQQVEQFRSINWMGEATVKIQNQFDLPGLSRSYSIKSGNEIICQIEQYFTPQFNKLFYT